MKYLLIGILLLWSSVLSAHPDGAKPYWYPSAYLYGFIHGCWESVEQNQILAEGMWPDDIRQVCGCTIDAIRHSIPYHDVEKRDPVADAIFDEITRSVLPVCISEQEQRIQLRNGKK